MAEKLQFDLDVANNNLKKALNEAITQVSKLEQKSGSIKFDPIFGNQFVADTKNASDNILKVGEATKDAEKDAINFGTVMSFVYGNLIVASVNSAKNAIFDFVNGSINAYAEQELAVNRLNASLQANGNFTESASKDLQEYASALQETTRFSDDAALGAIALLGSMTKLDNDGLKRAATGASNLAAQFGKDLPQVIETLGRAFNGQTKGLREFGIQFKDTGDRAQNFEGIMSLLEKKFNGAAQKDLETYAAKILKFKNEINDSQEAIGKSIIDTGIFQTILGKAASAAAALAGGTKALSETFGDTTKLEKLNKTLDTYKTQLLDITETDPSRAKFLENESKLIQQKIKDTEGLIRVEEFRNRQAPPGDFGPKTSEKDTKNDALIEAERKTQDEITNIQIEAEIARQSERDQLKNLEIENVGERAIAEIETANENAVLLADAKYQAKLRENGSLATLSEQNLADEKAREERKTAIIQANSARNIAIKKQELATEKQLSQAQGQLAVDALNLGAALSKEGSAKQKVFATASATVNAYVAFSNALANVPYPANLFAAGSALAVGLANVARINSVTAFESGGMIGVGSVSQGILRGGPTSGDKTLFRGNAGEVVLNEANQENLANKLQGNGGIPSFNLYLDGKEIAYSIRERVQSGFKLA